MASLQYIRERRGLPFVKRGMRVEIAYKDKVKRGVITGANCSGNLNIRMDGHKHSSNCHPRWAIKYFDKEGNVIAEFPE